MRSSPKDWPWLERVSLHADLVMLARLPHRGLSPGGVVVTDSAADGAVGMAHVVEAEWLS